jgi:hypothetical protein
MKNNLARALIGIVLGVNLQSAVALLIWPAIYAGQLELAGAPGGEAAVRGFGVLFLMWNVPYAVALWNPARYSLALHICLVMQAIGLLGEIFIFTSLPPAHEMARSSLMRFIVFDAFGLAALLLAAWLARGRTAGIT